MMTHRIGEGGLEVENSRRRRSGHDVHIVRLSWILPPTFTSSHLHCLLSEPSKIASFVHFRSSPCSESPASGVAQMALPSRVQDIENQCNFLKCKNWAFPDFLVISISTTRWGRWHEAVGEPSEAVVVEAYDNSGAGLLVNPAAWASSLSQNLAIIKLASKGFRRFRIGSDIFRHLDSSEAVRAFVAEGSQLPSTSEQLKILWTFADMVRKLHTQARS